MAERLVLPAPIRRKTPRQTAEEDKAIYAYVNDRDRGCRARDIDPSCGPCRGRLEREHVRYSAAMGGRRITVRGGVLLLCTKHHHDGWATSHKDAERAYLRRIEADDPQNNDPQNEAG